MSSRVGKLGGTGLFDVGVVVWFVQSTKRISTNDCLPPGSDANLDIEFLGRHGLQAVKFVLPTVVSPDGSVSVACVGGVLVGVKMRSPGAVGQSL